MSYQGSFDLPAQQKRKYYASAFAVQVDNSANVSGDRPIQWDRD